MKTLKLLGAALAAVTMTFTAQAAKTAKAVVADSGKTLKFVYDETNYGTKDTDWFSVAEAEAIERTGTGPDEVVVLGENAAVLVGYGFLKDFV